MKILNHLLANFVSYSQDFEDFILFYVFYDVERGFYVDVGANDPNFISVTKAFYERGWNGINIEPLPYEHKLLLQNRKRDINLRIGVGETDGSAKLRVQGLVSSLFYSKEIENVSKIININITTMSKICRKYVPNGIQIQFCKIDVERSEKNVLLGFDFINYRPKVFCIESLINKTTNIPEYKKWEFILTNNDYNLAYILEEIDFIMIIE